MRNFLLLFIAIVFTSCTTSKWIQVCKVSPAKGESVKLKTKECDIDYYMNAYMGSLDLYVRNNTDKVITIDLSQSFACINDKATDYFMNGQISLTTSLTQSADQLWGDKLSSALYNKGIQYLSIPPRSVRVISGPHIMLEPIKTDDAYPNKKSQAYKYNYETSPVRITTGLTYVLNGESKYISNDLYVSEVTNYAYDYQPKESKSSGIYTVKKKTNPAPVVRIPVSIFGPYAYFTVYSL